MVLIEFAKTTNCLLLRSAVLFNIFEMMKPVFYSFYGKTYTPVKYVQWQVNIGCAIREE